MIDELKLIALDTRRYGGGLGPCAGCAGPGRRHLRQPREHRFVMALNRFDWMAAADANAARQPDYRRCRTALRFERVLSCKCRDLDQSNKDTRLNLLAVEFAERDAPAGVVTMTFSGGGVIRLEVECLEAELADLGEVFAADVAPIISPPVGDGVACVRCSGRPLAAVGRRRDRRREELHQHVIIAASQHKRPAASRSADRHSRSACAARGPDSLNCSKSRTCSTPSDRAR